MKKLLRSLSKYILLVVLVLLFVLFSSINPRFLRVSNIMEMLRTASIVGIISLGQMLAFSCGEMDFAVGAEAAFGGVFLGVLVAIPALANNAIYWILLLVTLGVGMGIGLLNGFLITFIRMPAFIATLAVSTLLTGIGKNLTLGTTLYSTSWPSAFIKIGQGYIAQTVPVAVILYLLLALAVFILTERTKLGRYIYAVGANPETCRNVGIPVKQMKCAALILCALLCTFAGVIQASQLNVASPYASSSVLLNAISATMLGATFYRPGSYNVPGSVVAAVMMTVMSNGMTMAGTNAYARDAVLGIILLIAVGIIAKLRKGGLPAVSFDR